MKFRYLPGTDLRISELSLGTAELGMEYGISTGSASAMPSRSEAARILHRALDLGINHVDTARAYGCSEAVIGEAISPRRKDYFLTTKVAVPQAKVPERDSIATMIESVERSLRYLRTDCVDVLMLHSASLEEIESGWAAGVLTRLREQGKCRYSGASVYGSEAATAAIRTGSFQCLQVAYSLLDRRAETAVFPEAVERGVGIVARSILLKGALTHRCQWLTDALRPLRDQVRILASEFDCLPRLAYRFALGRVPPHSVLVGAGSLTELEQCASFVDCAPLTEEEAKRVNEVPALPDAMLNPAKWPAS